MGTNVSDLPEGFVLDDAVAQPQPTQEVPTGFTLDAEPSVEVPEGFTLDAKMPGIGEAFTQGLKAGVGDVALSAKAVGGGDVGQPQAPSPAAAPFELADPSDISGSLQSFGSKVAYKLAASAPMLGGGVAGTVGGTLATGGNPLGGLAGGVTGAGVGAAAQTLGPIFQAELQKYPDDPEKAWTAAMKSAGASGVFSGAGWALFPVKFFQGPVKNLLFQTFAVQPATAIGERVAINEATGQPLGQDVGTAATEAAVMGAATLLPATKIATAAGKKVGGFFKPKEDLSQDRPWIDPQGEAPKEVADPEQPGFSRDGKPLKDLRKSMMSVAKDSEDFIDLPDVEPREDIMETSVLLGDFISQLQAQGKMKTAYHEHMGEYDQQVPRYIVEGSEDTHFFSPTDLEQELALRGNIEKAPGVSQVDLSTLDPEKISAMVMDVPYDSNSRRVKLGKVTPEEYAQLIDYVSAGDPVAREFYYGLLEKGLRVLPNPGGSFIYGGDYSFAKVGAVPVSGRARMPLLVDDAGNTFISDGVFDRREAASDGMQGVPSVDIFRLPEGIFANYSLSKVKQLPASTTPEQKARWLSASRTADIPALKALAKEGIFVPVKNADLVQEGGSTRVFAIKDVPEEAMVHSYLPIPLQDRLPMLPGDVPIRDSKVELDLKEYDKKFDPATAKQAEEVATMISEFKPAIDDIFRRFGAVKSPSYVVNTNSGSPFVNPSKAEIVWPTRFVETLMKGGQYTPLGSLKDNVTQIIMHEVGHIVTVRTWEKLPADVQGVVMQGYRRALLNQQVQRGVEGVTPTGTMEANLFRDPSYYVTFPEWQAEQFRRWANQDGKTLSELDNYLSAGGRSIAKLQEETAQRFGERARQQLFQADYSFHTWMDYLEYAARHGENPLQMALLRDRRDAQPPRLSREIQDVVKDINSAIQELKKALVPEGVKVSIDETSDDLGGIQRGGYDPGDAAIRLIATHFARYGDKAKMALEAQATLVHEAVHSIDDVLTFGQKSLLVQLAKEQKAITASNVRAYKKYYREQYSKNKALTKGEVDVAVSKALDKEYRAFIAEKYFVEGKRFGQEVDTIYQKMQLFFERVGNLLQGKGFRTGEDVIRSFFKGEITDKMNRVQRRRDRKISSRREVSLAIAKNVDSLKRRVFDQGVDKDRLEFRYYDEKDNLVASMELSKPDGVDYDTEMIQVYDRKFRGRGLPEKMIKDVEEFTGRPLKTSGTFTQEGYNMMNRRQPERVRNYIQDNRTGLWHSPKFIWAMLDYAEQRAQQSEKQYAALDRDNLAHWKEMAKKVPASAIDDPMLVRQWSMRDWETNERLEDATVRANGKVRDITGEAEGLADDPFEAVAAVQRDTLERKNAKITGYSQGAAPQPEFLAIRNIFKKYGGDDPTLKPLLTGLDAQADKISAIGKKWLTIRQLAWKNPHIPELRDYISIRDQQYQRTLAWIARADDTSRVWDKLPEKQRDGLTELLFWATEMKYRTPQEVKAKVSRMPTRTELMGEARRLGITRDTYNLYGKINTDFTDFLGSMEKVFADQIPRRIRDPQAQAKALAELQSDMAALRRKPYFPMVRFGKYSLTARDPNTRGIKFFSLYQTLDERDAAARVIDAQSQGYLDINVSIVPEHSMEFMGLPGPLLEKIKQFLPGLTASQRAWLDRFSQLQAPQNSFKKRWLERKGTPGYSLDGVRAYAQYFRSASRYLARIEFHDDVQATIAGLDKSSLEALDGKRRQTITSMVHDHAEWMDTAGKDWTNFKALVTHYQLGFSPAAAVLNLTQTPVVTYPYLSSIFGEKAVFDILQGVAGGAKRGFGVFDRAKDPNFTKAHDEIVRQGRIDIGQASELGSFADTSRVDQSYLGSKAQKALRSASYWSMFMFGQAERFNREITFEAAYRAALNDINNPHVIDLAILKTRDITDIIQRTGLPFNEAIATIVAREAIDRTQGVYQSWDRPKFLQSKLGGASRIFFSFIQQTLNQLGNNPGRAKMFLAYALLYGATGMPFAEDIDSVIHAIAVKMFGKDFSIKKFTRELIRDMTKGTFLDEVGPDLFQHGISRYSFGAGLLPESWGMPQFDASGNGSLGKIIPGFADLMNGIADSGDDPNAWKDISAKVGQDLAGPGIGMIYPFLQYMTSAPYSADQKKWESLLPRSGKAFAKAYHMAVDGQVSTKQGGALVKFDMDDPNDRATVVAQALGFNPTKVSQKYEMLEMANSTDSFYNAKKMSITVRMLQAIQTNNNEKLSQVQEDLKAYNDEVVKAGFADKAIGKSLVQSLKQRIKTQQMQNLGLPLQKSQTGIFNKTKDLFPGVIVEEKKVK